MMDADTSKYFDRVAHHRLRGILDLRIKDGVIRRTIDKWSKAGIIDAGHTVYFSAAFCSGCALDSCLLSETVA